MYSPTALFSIHSYTRIDPAQEIGRLRHSISLLEAYIFPHHRSNPALQKRPSEVSSHTTPKKEVIDPDVSDKTQPAHGFLGRQAQGGLYAGPTSAATHLITVINSGMLITPILFLKLPFLGRNTYRRDRFSSEPGTGGLPRNI